MTLFLLVTLLAAACFAASNAGAEDLETFVIQIPDPKETFRAEDLTWQQASLCAEFRRLIGKYRKPAFDVLWQAGALPIEQKRVSELQVAALLGAPDRKEKDRMIYSLGFGDGGGHSLDILIVDGRAAMIGFSKTL